MLPVNQYSQTSVCLKLRQARYFLKKLFILYWSIANCTFLVAQMVKNTPAIQETWVRSLGRKDPPEKGMATHSSILAWRIPWTEEPGRLESMGLQRAGLD